MRGISDVFAGGDLVFDVGANIGNKTAQYVAQGARVVCFEPQPQCVENLRERFSTNRHVTIVPKGLAEYAGRLTLSICDENTLSTFSEEWKCGRHASNRWARCVEVEVTTLDQAISEFGRPRYCKIDVEGFEMSVLRGLTQAIDVLSFEFTKEFIENAAAAVSYLNEIGMNEFTVVIGESAQFATQDWGDGHLLVDAIRNDKRQWLWGDVYARKSVEDGQS